MYERFTGTQSSPFPIFDQSARSPALGLYAFVRAGNTDATLSGYFVNLDGRQVSPLVTMSITSEATTFLQELGEEAIPDEAYGFIGQLTQDIYFGTGVDPETGSIPEELVPGAGYPRIVATTMFIVGRVSL